MSGPEEGMCVRGFVSCCLCVLLIWVAFGAGARAQARGHTESWVGTSAVGTSTGESNARFAASGAGSSSGDPAAVGGRILSDSTRAQKWRAMRYEKAQSMESPSPSIVQRTVAFFERNRSRVLPDRLVLDIPNADLFGIQPVLGGLPGEAGATGGLFYEIPFSVPEERYAHVQALASLKRYWGAEAIGGWNRGRWHGFGFARYTSRAAESFYGIGPTSDLDRRSYYRLNQGIGGALIGYAPARQLFTGSYLAYRTDRVGPGRHVHGPSVTNIDERPAPIGYSADVDDAIAGIFAEFDSRDVSYDRHYGQRFAPTSATLRGISLDASSGYYLAASLTHHQDVVKRDYSYARLTVDAQQYVALKHGMQRGFAFRQYVSLSDSPARQRVPFYRMPTLGGSTSLRGFTGGRFRDRNAVLATAEMRCRIWHRLDMALFTDAGQVFNRFDDIALQEMMVGYGVGFRFRSSQGVIARFEVARSVEGISTYLKFGSVL
jgi:hypothetical protein